MSTTIGLLVLGLIAAIILLLLACIFCFTDWGKRRNNTHAHRGDPEIDVQPQPVNERSDMPVPRTTELTAISRHKSFQTRSFSHDELEKATNAFSTENWIGEGGFGHVYKGILADGRQVAVKKLKAGSSQGHDQFGIEIETMGRIHHRNLVHLFGYCIDSSANTLLLVYEFVPNNSLKSHLHGNVASAMKWPIRMKIAIGSAKGLKYLHEDCKPRIIHRDVKTDNILLEDNFEPKLADFGLAKLFSDTATHVSTDMKGTFGYMPPEYHNCSRELTVKSDIYSFGVVLWELITGKRATDSRRYGPTNLAGWANAKLRQRNYSDLIDPKLENHYDNDQLNRMISSAEACTLDDPKRRPQMSQVVEALEGPKSSRRK
ncbi:proline-rich receptor-like protein kinase PERK1 [Mercurialis annua]|uniref:proline-rich receptor-like protein kinase PERK1 n=1 Tax=Mercurialis annua TaxID=3986 RepID=UPI002160993A|nr:proline-rich receptor-like protein kinase PERK1 [Mercurialis annua]